MEYDSKSGELSTVKGDTGNLEIKPNGYLFDANDVVRFSVKKNLTDKDYAISKTAEILDSDLAVISFAASDTKNLKAGQYWYDIEFRLKDGTISTMQGTPAILRLKEGVTND